MLPLALFGTMQRDRGRGEETREGELEGIPERKESKPRRTPAPPKPQPQPRKTTEQRGSASLLYVLGSLVGG